MAVSVINPGALTGILVHVNTDVDETEDDVDDTSGVIYAIEVDNTLNAAIIYLKLYEAASGSVTVGTTAPDHVIRIAAVVKRTILIPEGLAYATALTIAALTTGGTAGTTGPTAAVTVRLTYST